MLTKYKNFGIGVKKTAFSTFLFFTNRWMSCESRIKDIEKLCGNIEESQWLKSEGEVCQQRLLETKFCVTQNMEDGEIKTHLKCREYLGQ